MTEDQPNYSFKTANEPQFMIINGSENKWLVKMNMKDGSMEFGEGYEPSEAARIFWNSVSTEYREFVAWKAQHKTGTKMTI